MWIKHSITKTLKGKGFGHYQYYNLVKLWDKLTLGDDLLHLLRTVCCYIFYVVLCIKYGFQIIENHCITFFFLKQTNKILYA